MPSVNFTYPGVYIEEIPSGIVTITGVATSITAFVGRTPMGPVAPDEPIHCYSFADFERYFGGRTDGYPLTYAVEDFFQNGGSDAVVVRVYKSAAPQQPSGHSADTGHAAVTGHAASPTHHAAAAGTGHATGSNASSGANSPPASPQPAADGYATESSKLNLRAYSPGTWANTLTASIDTIGISDQVAAQYTRYGLAKADLFNLTLTYTRPDKTTVVERYTNVAVKTVNNVAAPNRLDSVLKSQSQLATVTVDATTNAPNLPAETPQSTYTTDAKGKSTDNPLPFTGGADSANLVATDIEGDELERTGIYALDHVDLFNIMCIPWDQPGQDFDETMYQHAAEYCQKRRAMLIIDPPTDWASKAIHGQYGQIDPSTLGMALLEARNCAVYFPRIKKINEEKGGITEVFPACGAIAGIYAATDLQRGVWKAPAGITAGIGNIVGLEMNLTDAQNGALNTVGINCLRTFPIIGSIVWGARTLRGADLLSDDYKYVPVRRLTLFIEESLYRGTKFAVFEPNDEALWSQLRLSIGTFMADLARQGAFYNYQVVCDKTTTTADDIARGIVNVIVAFAPVKPAEFIVLKIQQQAAQLSA
jgi:phage tail sheath protein FI